MTSGSQTVDLRSNLRTHSGKTCKRAIEWFLPHPPSPYSSRATASFVGKCRTQWDYGEIWPLVNSRDVIFDLSEKNDRRTFGRPFSKLSNAACRFSLRCLVFEISGGGGHPPPVGAKLAQPHSSVRGLRRHEKFKVRSGQVTKGHHNSVVDGKFNGGIFIFVDGLELPKIAIYFFF